MFNTKNILDPEEQKISFFIWMFSELEIELKSKFPDTYKFYRTNKMGEKKEKKLPGISDYESEFPKLENVYITFESCKIINNKNFSYFFNSFKYKNDEETNTEYKKRAIFSNHLSLVRKLRNSIVHKKNNQLEQYRNFYSSISSELMSLIASANRPESIFNIGNVFGESFDDLFLHEENILEGNPANVNYSDQINKITRRDAREYINGIFDNMNNKKMKKDFFSHIYEKRSIEDEYISITDDDYFFNLSYYIKTPSIIDFYILIVEDLLKILRHNCKNQKL